PSRCTSASPDGPPPFPSTTRRWSRRGRCWTACRRGSPCRATTSAPSAWPVYSNLPATPPRAWRSDHPGMILPRFTSIEHPSTSRCCTIRAHTDVVRTDGSLNHSESQGHEPVTGGSPAAQPSRAELRLHVHGMNCADEASLVRHVLAVKGVIDLDFDLVGRRVDVAYDPAAISPDAIVALAAATGLGVHTHARGEAVHDDAHAHGHAQDHRHGTRWAMASGAAMAVGWSIEAWFAESWI